ncbi:MAG: amino acid permease, partial [Thermotogae bacterium]|nr:amino acid permease [Thermotogota bacterium]
LAGQAAVSRILFAMGRNRQLPSFFAKIHEKYKTPYISIIISAIVTMALIFLLTLKDLSSLVNFGALSAFIMLNFSLIVLFFKEKKYGKSFVSLIGLIVVAAIWANIDSLAKTIGFIWLAVGFIYLLYITKGFKRSVVIPEED